MTTSTSRVEPKDTLILVVDVQERLASAMPPARLADTVRAGTILLEAAATFGASVLATEQYPQGLGPTVAALAERLDAAGAPRLAKTSFSACGDAAIAEQLNALGKHTVVVLGMETHVCVFQTVRDLAGRGFRVLVPLDGVASRRDDHREIGLELCRAAGATVTTTETLVFDWLGAAGSDAFKRLSKLIR
jgi:nicotinamidase-related amidase